jgi:RNA polymerase sigma-70 factor (sigma-E family)
LVVTSDSSVPVLDATNTASRTRETGAVVDPYVAESFETFVRANSAALLRRALLLTGDRDLAEDLVQTALAKVALRWTSVAAKGDPLPYVRTVIVRTAIGWRRRRWSGEVPTAPLPETSQADGSENIARRERLRQALLGVPARQRAALMLRFYDDLSEAATAQVMGCSVGTVKSQTSKGLARLRVVLGADPTSTPESGEDR